LGNLGTALIGGLGIKATLPAVRGIAGPITKGVTRAASSGFGRAALGTAAGIGVGELLFGGGSGNGGGRRRRRMDVLNMRALDRSLRRIEGFERRVNKVTKILGKPKRSVKAKKKCRR
jgi:hypothetical protein